jgi:alkyl sulfatase BDS1-like metallo-beta-lactamase superfamily hydrolase
MDKGAMMSGEDGEARHDATEATRAANDALAASLPFEDRRDFEEAVRGLIGAFRFQRGERVRMIGVGSRCAGQLTPPA